MITVSPDYELDLGCREVRHRGVMVHVEPQVFDILVHLICHRYRVVTKDELVQAVWDGRPVSDATLTSRINAARRVVGDTGKQQRVIRTVPRRGFRFIGDVHDRGEDVRDSPSAVASAAVPSVVANGPFK